MDIDLKSFDAFLRYIVLDKPELTSDFVAALWQSLVSTPNCLMTNRN